MSCTSCKSSPCCCNGKRFRGNVDIKTVPGPKGDKGDKGDDGADGAQGPPGAGGGLQFEYYTNYVPDAVWDEVEAVIPASSYNISGGDGDYQIHLNVDVFAHESNAGEIRLYVNGVSVAVIVINDQTNAARSHEGMKNGGLTWRGNILNGQTVDVRQVLGLPKIGANGAVTRTLIMLINKES